MDQFSAPDFASEDHSATDYASEEAGEAGMQSSAVYRARGQAQHKGEIQVLQEVRPFGGITPASSEPPSPRRPPPELIRTPEPKQVSAPKEPLPWEAGGQGVLSEDKPNRFRTLLFDMNIRAKNLVISADHTSVSYRGAPYGGFVLTQQPLKRKAYGRFFEVIVEEVDIGRWVDGLGIGIASKTSAKERALNPDVLANLEGYACELLPESWLIGYDGRAKLRGISRYLRGKELPAGMWKPTELRPGDRISLLATAEGHLVFFVNANVIYYATCCDIPWLPALHGVVDLDGCTKSIHLLDNTGIPPEVEAAMVRLKEHDPLFRPDSGPRPDFTPGEDTTLRQRGSLVWKSETQKS